VPESTALQSEVYIYFEGGTGRRGRQDLEEKLVIETLSPSETGRCVYRGPTGTSLGFQYSVTVP